LNPPMQSQAASTSTAVVSRIVLIASCPQGGVNFAPLSMLVCPRVFINDRVLTSLCATQCFGCTRATCNLSVKICQLVSISLRHANSISSRVQWKIDRVCCVESISCIFNLNCIGILVIAEGSLWIVHYRHNVVWP